jgi:foldase protein PrsA
MWRRAVSEKQVVAILLAVGSLSGCGGSAPGSSVAHDAGNFVVAQIGGRSITKTMLDHWMSMTAPEGVVPGSSNYTAYIACVVRQEAAAPKSAEGQSKPTGAGLKGECRQRSRMQQEQTLNFLISSVWLIGEAADRRLAVSDQEVERRFEEQKNDWFPNGGAEFREFLETTGQTASDIRFAIKAQLASTKIGQMVMENERKVTQAQVVEYYRKNIRRFQLLPEQRDFDILEHLESEAAVRKVKREVASGKSFANMAIHESLERPSSAAKVSPGKVAIERAVFSAKPGVLGGPVSLDNYYSLFEVTRITAATQQTLAQAQSSIEKQLTTEQHQRALAGFIRAWRRKWISRTDCHTGDVVRKCRQYKASTPPPPEDPYTFN